MEHVLVPEVVDVAGCETFYVQRGKRNASHVVLILHGFMSDYRSMQITAENIEIDDDTYVLLPDLPGFGSSAPPKEYGTTLDDYGQWVDAFLQAVAPKAKKVTIVGYSFGAYVAIGLAVRAPKRVARLLLVTPVIQMTRSVRLHTSGFETLAQLSVEAAHKLYKWRPHFDFTTLYLARSHNPERVIKLFEHRRKELPALQPELVLGLYKEILHIDLLSVAPQITAPVVALIAEKDNVAVNAATETFMERIGSKQKKTILLPKAGHMVPFEEPERLATVLNAGNYLQPKARFV